MARVVLAFIASTLLLGCSHHPMERRLDGRWLGQGVENVDDPFVAQATGWARGTVFEFHGDEVRVTIPAHETRRGRYEVKRVNHGEVNLLVVGQDETKYPLRLVLDDEHSMRWLLADGRAVVFRRELPGGSPAEDPVTVLD